MKVHLAAAAAGGLILLTAPPAMGADIFSDRGCYREGTVGKFFGTGFQPGQPVALSLDGQQLATGTANPAGGVAAVVGLPPIPRSEQRRAVSLTQTTNPGLSATKNVIETKLYVVTKPSRFRPGRRLRIRAGGFYGAGATLYGHVRGPKRRNVRIGRVTGECGKVSATRKVILKRRDRFGFYIVQFDTVRRYLGFRTSLQFRKAYSIRPVLRISRTSPFAAPVFGGASG